MRNQGIRLGAAAIGKALTTTGAATVAYGANVYRKPSTTRTDLFITRKDLKKKVTRSEFKELKKRHRFMPSNDRRQQRWVEKSVRRQGVAVDTPKARGRTIMRTGTTMIGVGRALPVMAVGWVVTDAALRAARGEAIQDQDTTQDVVTMVREFHDQTIGGLSKTLTIASVGYAIAKDVGRIIL